MSTKKIKRSERDLGSPLIMDTEDVMYLTGFGRGKVEKAWQSGELVAFKVGRLRRFHSRDVQAWTWNLRNQGMEANLADDVEI